MGILENAIEFDRLFALQERAETLEAEAAKRKRDADAEVERLESQRSEAYERVEALSDGMAGIIPTTLGECLALVALLRSMTSDSVFYHDNDPPRIRADRILDNLLVGLKRLAPSESFANWIEEQIRDAETGTTRGYGDDAPSRGANENRRPVQQH